MFYIFLIQKGIMKPLMELSATLDTYRPNSAQLFRSISAGSKSELIDNESKYFLMNIKKNERTIYFLTNFRS